MDASAVKHSKCESNAAGRKVASSCPKMGVLRMQTEFFFYDKSVPLAALLQIHIAYLLASVLVGKEIGRLKLQH